MSNRNDVKNLNKPSIKELTTMITSGNKYLIEQLSIYRMNLSMVLWGLHQLESGETLIYFFDYNNPSYGYEGCDNSEAIEVIMLPIEMFSEGYVEKHLIPTIKFEKSNIWEPIDMIGDKIEKHIINTFRGSSLDGIDCYELTRIDTKGIKLKGLGSALIEVGLEKIKSGRLNNEIISKPHYTIVYAEMEPFNSVNGEEEPINDNEYDERYKSLKKFYDKNGFDVDTAPFIWRQL